VQQLLLIFWQICLMKKGPQDVPFNRFLMWAVILVVMLLQSLLWHTFESPLPFISLIASSFVVIVFTMLLLLLQNKFDRWVQTLTAGFGASFFLLLISGSIQLAIFHFEVLAMPGSLIVLLTYIWGVAIDGHIFKHALDIPFRQGVALAAMLFLLQLTSLSFFIEPSSQALK